MECFVENGNFFWKMIFFFKNGTFFQKSKFVFKIRLMCNRNFISKQKILLKGRPKREEI